MAAVAAPAVPTAPNTDAVEPPDGRAAPHADADAERPSLWAAVKSVVTPLRAVELLVYAGWLALLFGDAFTSVSDKMNATCDRIHGCNRYRVAGLLGGRVDAGDAQWYKLSRFMPDLVGGMVALVPLSWLWRTGCGRLRATATPAASPDAEGARDGSVPPARRVSTSLRRWFMVSTSLVFIAYLHGPKFVFVVAVVAANFAIAHVRSPMLTWVFAAAMLLANEFRRPWFSFTFLLPAYRSLDRAYPELYSWHKCFNLVMLRMVSFNMDLVWAERAHARADASAAITVDERRHPKWSYEWRVATPQPLKRYSFSNYFAYVFYIPLVIAGPTITFNAFASQVYTCIPHRARDIALYAARWVAAFVLFEVCMDYFPVFALSKQASYTRAFTPWEVGVHGYFMLKFTWFKFLLIWRLFRLWALADGVETVENMNRCMSNNYSLQGFWRAWHRSFNRWLVRYIYVPLGGSRVRVAADVVPALCPPWVREWVSARPVALAAAGIARRVLNVFVVFTFVALWHDMTFKLLAWGWLLVLFFTPELIANAVVARPGMRWLREAWWYRHVCSAAGAANIFAMMVANLVGFRVGTDGTWVLMQQIADPLFVAGAFFAFFGATQLMLVVREVEAAKGGVLVQATQRGDTELHRRL